MNGTTQRTKRTIVCREAHKQLPHLLYKQVVAVAKEHHIMGTGSDDVKNLVAIASKISK